MSLAAAKPFAAAAWNLNEASSTRADSVGSSDLTDNNSVGSASGMFGNAASFNPASSQSLSIADNAALSVGDVDFCVRAWVKLTSTGASRVILAKDSGTNGEYYLYYHTGTDRFRWEVYSASGFNGQGVAAASNFGSPSTGTWYLVHAWHDSLNDVIGISVNAGTANTTSFSAGIFDSTGSFRLGNDSFSDKWDGLIDDVVVLKSRVLDATERTADYNSGAGVAFATWAGGGSTTLAVDAGAYALTGQTAALRADRRLSAAGGSYAETGQAAALKVDRRLSVAVGSFALTGQNATLTFSGAGNKTLAVDPGSFALAGQSATLRAARVLSVGVGSLALTGQSAGLRADRKLGAGAASCLLSGSAATLTYSGATAPGIPHAHANIRGRRNTARTISGRRDTSVAITGR